MIFFKKTSKSSKSQKSRDDTTCQFASVFQGPCAGAHTFGHTDAAQQADVHFWILSCIWVTANLEVNLDFDCWNLLESLHDLVSNPWPFSRQVFGKSAAPAVLFAAAASARADCDLGERPESFEDRCTYGWRAIARCRSSMLFLLNIEKRLEPLCSNCPDWFFQRILVGIHWLAWGLHRYILTHEFYQS